MQSHRDPAVAPWPGFLAKSADPRPRLWGAGILAAGLISLAGCAEVGANQAPKLPEAPSAPAASPASPAAAPAEADAATDATMDEEEGVDVHSGSMAGDSDEGDDGDFDGTMLDHPELPSARVANAHSPLADLAPSELERRVKTDIASLGSLSLGATNRGRLVNGVQMPESAHYSLTSPSCAYGTQETVDSLGRAIDKVFAKYPDSQKLIIGHISAKNGGRLSPHKSHQAGRDVDISYFYTDTKNWYAVANDKNLDRERTWTFIKALLGDPDIEMIFMDVSIQKLLKEHALKAGEDPKWLDEVFQYGSHSASPIIRHVKGHATHVHIRFVSPVAQASARIASAYLPHQVQPTDADDTHVAAGRGHHSAKSKPDGSEKIEYILHRARSGDTLDSLARHYGVSVRSIQDANSLANNKIRMNATYRIPKVAPLGGGRVAASSDPVTTRPRGSAHPTVAQHGGSAPPGNARSQK